MIAGYWEDFLGARGRNRWKSMTINNQQLFVVEWNNVDHYPSGNQSTFRIILNLTDHRVVTQCVNCVSDGGSHTQGLRSHITNHFDALSGRVSQSWNSSLSEVVYQPLFISQ